MAAKVPSAEATGAPNIQTWLNPQPPALGQAGLGGPGLQGRNSNSGVRSKLPRVPGSAQRPRMLALLPEEALATLGGLPLLGILGPGPVQGVCPESVQGLSSWVYRNSRLMH